MVNAVKNGKAKIFVPIAKVDDDERMVYGYATTEALDNQGEIIKIDAVKNALDEYMKFANVREMHQPSAVGVCKMATVDSKGLYVGIKVVDDSAWKKVKEEVYKGFSIGGSTIKKVDKSIVKMRLTEISLVDRPCNPEATIELWKMDASEPLQKGMYEVSSLADFLARLNSLRQAVDAEAMYENDGSQIGSRIKDAIDSLAGILVEMTQEETAELTAKMAAADDIAKAGSRNSKDDMARIQQLHDLAVELGANCGSKTPDKKDDKPDDKPKPDDTQKSEPMGELLKAFKAAAENMAQAAADIKKMAAPPAPQVVKTEIAVGQDIKKADFSAAVSEIMKRLEKIEGQPAAAKVILKAVDKEADSPMAKVETQPDNTDPLAAIRKIHQDGPIGRV